MVASIPMADVVLTTLNAKYAHASLGLRYLAANMGDLRERTVLLEFTIHDRATDIAETLLTHKPRIIGLGVYIWNAELSLQLVRLLKAVSPEVIVVLGGPEVSHESESQAIVAAADHTIAGEGDLAFAELCRQLLEDLDVPQPKLLRPPPPNIADVAPPYDEYTDVDLRERTVYVEASRGCPFSCEFCLSSLDIAVRQFDLDNLLGQLDNLLARGVRQFKFVDRTFNLKVRTASAILEFFLKRIDKGLFVHFEMVPDRLPVALRSIIARFPPGSLQFEVGIQTFDAETSQRISRRQNLAKLEDNMRFLRSDTGVHVHADLIVGLPGEDMSSFAQGFDRLVALGPQEIQVGILKRLRGTPIGRHDHQWNAVYTDAPPYEILRNSLITFADMQRMKRFARAWDLVANSGNFRATTPRLWQDSTPFAGFMAFTDWLYGKVGAITAIALDRLTRLLFDYLTKVLGQPQAPVATDLAADYIRPGRRPPSFLTSLVHKLPLAAQPTNPATPKRQARHL